MEKLTYLKQKLRWTSDENEWPYYKRIVGCGVSCEADGAGYLLNSDGSKTATDDYDAALILLFSRALADRRGDRSFLNRMLCSLVRWLL